MTSSGVFTDKELEILQAALDRACRELGILSADKEGQTRVAEAIFALSDVGQLDVQKLTNLAVYHCRYPEH